LCINSIDQKQAALASNRKVSLCTQTLACVRKHFIWHRLVKTLFVVCRLLHFVSCIIFRFQAEVIFSSFQTVSDRLVMSVIHIFTFCRHFQLVILLPLNMINLVMDVACSVWQKIEVLFQIHLLRIVELPIDQCVKKKEKRKEVETMLLWGNNHI
jgi:hypothetical protein